MLFEKTLSFVEKCFRPWWCFKALYYCGESWKLQTWLSWGANITGHKLRDLFFIWKKGARTKLLEKLLGKKKTPSRKIPSKKLLAEKLLGKKTRFSILLPLRGNPRTWTKTEGEHSPSDCMSSNLDKNFHYEWWSGPRSAVVQYWGNLWSGWSKLRSLDRMLKIRLIYEPGNAQRTRY